MAFLGSAPVALGGKRGMAGCAWAIWKP